MLDKRNHSIKDAKGSGHLVRIPIPSDVSINFALLLRNLDEGVDTRNPFRKTFSAVTPENASEA